jgi:STE24 endopeptidase
LAATQLWDTVVPGDLTLPEDRAAATFDASAREEAQSFEALNRILFLLSQVTLIVVLALYVKRGPGLMKESAAGPIGTGFLLGIMGIALVWLAQVPFGLVQVWWARKNGVLDTNYLDFVVGDFFALGGEAVALCLILLVVMGLARVLRSAWWIPSVGVVVAITAFFAFIGPFLMPGLDKPEPGIAAEARTLAKQQGLADVPVRVEDVHEYTDQPNAYAFGLGSTRKVVLWNTLADEFPAKEVRTVVAHELGHHKHHHIAKSIGWTALVMLPTALIAMLVTRRRGGLARPELVPVALLVYVLVQLAFTPLQSTASRRYEAEADWTALQAARDPKAQEALFRRFSRELLSDPDPPGWWHVAFDSHPSEAERVAMVMAWRERNGSQSAASAP